MDHLRSKGLRTLKLLQQGQHSLKDLAEELCICRRNVQEAITLLKNRGLSIQSRYKDRVKYFWIEPNTDLLLTILTLEEKRALTGVLTSHNSDLRSAVDKLTQCTLEQLYFQSTK